MTDANVNYSPPIEGQANQGHLPLWVVEGTLDCPVQLRDVFPDKPTSCVYIILGGSDPDGFVQLDSLDKRHVGTSEFWSKGDRWIFKCRGLVRCPDAGSALVRGAELYEHVADRLTLWSGYPTEILSVDFVYNESLPQEVIAGEAQEYEATSGGESSFSTSPPKNAAFTSFFSPPVGALEAIRWFRHAMLAKRILDQYLFYYISLESIAKHVPGVVRGPRRDSSGKEIDGKESLEAAAVKTLLQNRRLPAEGRKLLAEIRSRIARREH